MVSPDLPNFFLASGDQLVTSAAKGIQCVGQEGLSGYMVVRDETVFSKTYSLVYGLHPDDPTQGHVVGGMWPEHACIPMGDGCPDLAESRLADVTVATAVKSVSKKDDLFMIQMQPRSHSVTAREEFEAVGEILQSCYLTLYLQFVFSSSS